MPLLCKVPCAPCNGTSTPPKLVVTLPFPHHSTLQSHPAMAPSNGTTSTPPKLVLTLPPNHSTLLPSPHHSTLQWHPAMAPRPLQLVVSLPPNQSTLQWQPTMAPAWCHVQSAKVVRRPPPFLEVRTPIAIAIWGKTPSKNYQDYSSPMFFWDIFGDSLRPPTWEIPGISRPRPITSVVTNNWISPFRKAWATTWQRFFVVRKRRLGQLNELYGCFEICL